MPKIKYQDFNFRSSSLAVIENVNSVYAEYEAQGVSMTLRMIYYKFVSRDLFPDDRWWWWNSDTGKWIADPEHANDRSTKNAEPNYKWLGSLVNDGRLAGLIDWETIIDRTRELRALSHWTDPAEIIETCAAQFHLDTWRDQKYRPEVWVEKDAVLSVFESTCKELDVPILSCRGYTSQSEMWGSAQRMLKYRKQGQIPVIFHFGDHDPSGVDMTRDIFERLGLFTGRKLRLERVALTMEQIERYAPPPNPAKITDSRAKGYIMEFGNESWELDALEPNVIDSLLRQSIGSVTESALMQKTIDEQSYHRKSLAQISERFDDVREFLSQEE